MLNLDETITINSDYLIQRDLLIRILGYLIGVITIIEIIRSQVPEIYLLQLVPGFYLFLLLIFFIVFVNSTAFFGRISFQIDQKKTWGTKTIDKIQLLTLIKFGLLLSCVGLFFIFNSLLPLSLDEFNSYGEKTLENTWSFDEVLNLETFLLLILTLIIQTPLIAILGFNTEKDSQLLPQYWKTLSVLTFVTSGLLTPTIDGYTQFCFASSGLSLYLMIISIVLKRLIIKLKGFFNFS